MSSIEQFIKKVSAALPDHVGRLEETNHCAPRVCSLGRANVVRRHPSLHVSFHSWDVERIFREHSQVIYTHVSDGPKKTNTRTAAKEH